MAKRWSPEEDELIIRLRNEGLTAREIAVRLARSEVAVQARLSSKAKKQTLWTPEEEARLLELKQLGVPHRQIAYELKRTKRSIDNKVAKLL